MIGAPAHLLRGQTAGHVRDNDGFLVAIGSPTGD